MDATPGSVFKWDAVLGADNYDWQLWDAGNTTILNSGNVVAPEVSAAIVLASRPYGSYNFRVRAMDGSGPGTWTTMLSFDYVSLPAPGNVWIE